MYKPRYPGLYYFNNFTFTSLGNSGHRGPASDQKYADAPWRDGDFSIQDGIQSWTVPANGTYRIEVGGAFGAYPGRVVTGDVVLNKGQVLQMLVGQEPTPLTANVADNVTVGGGGGTFVTTNDAPLIVASGGDGSGPSSSPGSFLPSGSGNGRSGAGYLTDGEITNPFFGFLAPKAYVHGGDGNAYEYGQPTLPEDGGFGGGQSPINLSTPINQITSDGSVATCITTVPHGYPYNYQVNISGTTYYDGAQQIQVQTSNAFTFSTSNTQTVTSGTVSGIVSGSSGGGGYTGSPGDGTSGATCYADTSVQNFTDLGATSQASGYVSVSLVDPPPLPKNLILDQKWSDKPSTFPYGTTWSAATYGNGTYVAVSNNGTYPVTCSTDGINWLTQTYGSTVQSWVSVTFGNDLFVAVANDGSKMVSSDGIYWKSSTAFPQLPHTGYTTWTSITYGAGLFVAVNLLGSSPHITTSPDANSWTAQTVPDVSLVSVVYANGVFVALAPLGPTAYVFASNDGVNWTPGTAPSGLWILLAYGNGVWVAITPYGSPNVMTSPDGFNWTAHTAPVSNWNSLTYGNGLFVAISHSTFPYIMTSPDGINWTPQTAEFSPSFHVSAYGNGVFVSISSVGYETSITSPDGINWTQRSVPSGYWNAFTYANGLFVAIGADQGQSPSSIVMTSLDGINWTTSATVPGRTWYSITYGDGLWVAMSATSPNIMTSPDAINWTVVQTAPWSSVTSGNGLFVATSNTGAAYSTDGLNWTPSAVVQPDSWSSVTYGNGKFVAVANNGTTANVMCSSDGNVWSNATTGTTQDSWSAVAYGNGTFVAMAPNTLQSNAMYSTNGQTWTQGTSLPFSSNCITYGNGYFAAPSSNASVAKVGVTSNIANSWQLTTIPGASYTGITYGSHGFVGVSPTKFSIGFTPDFWVNSAQILNSNKLNFSQWNRLAYGNGTFVAVGNGLIQGTRNQGNTWNSFTSSNVSCITYSQNLGTFVAVSNTYSDGTYTSQDGINWTTYKTTTIGANTRLSLKAPLSSSRWNAVTYGNGTFVAAGDSNVMISFDGITWGVPFGSSIPIGTSPGIFLPYPISISSDGQKVLISSLNYSPNVFTNGFLSQTLSAPRVNEGFGWASAMNSDGTIIAVGAPNANSNVGNVYVYTNGILSYTLSGATANVLFGSSLALSANGSVLAVGAPGTGYVNVYTNGTLTRTFVGETVGDGFGWAAAISSDGTVFAVSALNIGFGISGAQKVYYTQGATTYTLSGNSSTDGFGWAIALSGDGTVLAVSALFAGYVNVYHNGTFAYKIQDSYTNQFGWALSTNSDGSVLAVCGPTSNNVYVYDGSGTLTNTYNGAGWQVAVSSDGTYILSSSQYGSNVTIYSSTAQNLNGDWKSIAYGNGQFLTAASDGSQLTSQDGINWTTVQGPPKSSWSSVAYGNGLFVAVGSGDQIPYVMTSPDGNNWTAQTAPNSGSTITYGNGLFVAGVDSIAGFVMTSPDGINWTLRPTNIYAYFNQITYGNGLFVAVTSFEARVITSPDGINWTAQTAPGIGRSVTYGNGLFVAGGPASNQFMSSPDGINWTHSAVEGVDYIKAIAYGNGLFVAASPVSFVTSPDGINWTLQNFNIGGSINSITYGKGLFVALGIAFSREGVIWTSPDGVNWTRSIQPRAYWQSITYGGDRFVAVASNGVYNGGQLNYTETPTVLTSTDAAHWTTSLTGNNVSIVHFNNLWVATSNTSIMYSTTGNIGTWSITTAPLDSWSSLASGNGYIMAVTNNGTYPAAFSQDGINWSTQTTGFQTTNWNSIVFGQNTFMALNAEGASTMVTQVSETF